MKNIYSQKAGAFIFFCTLFLFSFNGFAQVGIGNINPDASSLLDIGDGTNSNDKGILIPRVDIADLATPAPVTSPAISLLVYNTNTTTGPGFFYWNGTAGWVSIDGGNNWNLEGNEGTDAGTNFLGTTDNEPLRLSTNGAERIRVNANGNVGIGATNPTTTLDVAGALSLREGGQLTLDPVVTNDLDLELGSSSQYRLAATGSSGIRNIKPATDADGQIVNLINNSDFPITIRHNIGPAGTGNQRILCPDGKDVVLSAKYSNITLQYNKELKKWVVIGYSDFKFRYGDNINYKVGNGNISKYRQVFDDMDDMIISFTPRHPIVFVTFSASGHMDLGGSDPARSAYAEFQIVNSTNGNVVAGARTMATDHGVTFEGVNFLGTYLITRIIPSVETGWNANISMYPVSVIPGQPTTIKVQWRNGGVNSKRIYCNPGSSGHRSLTIFD